MQNEATQMLNIDPMLISDLSFKRGHLSLLCLSSALLFGDLEKQVLTTEMLPCMHHTVKLLFLF